MRRRLARDSTPATGAVLANLARERSWSSRRAGGSPDALDRGPPTGAGDVSDSGGTAALPVLVANLAVEVAPIRVNLIAAGFVDTPLSAALLGAAGPVQEAIDEDTPETAAATA